MKMKFKHAKHRVEQIKGYGKMVMILPFTILGLIAAVIIKIFLPETAGITLKETIDEVVKDNNSKRMK
uniref:Uncharacterized protein n=1 Tax=Acrobeloides nanus TaxID=290746 RepID=A0A914DSL9_9BILA